MNRQVYFLLGSHQQVKIIQLYHGISLVETLKKTKKKKAINGKKHHDQPNLQVI